MLWLRLKTSRVHRASVARDTGLKPASSGAVRRSHPRPELRRRQVSGLLPALVESSERSATTSVFWQRGLPCAFYFLFYKPCEEIGER